MLVCRCHRWMSRSAMRPAEGGDASDCILVVGVSRSKMAVAFLSVALLSLFLTFHILYDSAVYSLHAVSAVEGRTVELVSQVRVSLSLTRIPYRVNVSKDLSCTYAMVRHTATA